MGKNLRFFIIFLFISPYLHSQDTTVHSFIEKAHKQYSIETGISYFFRSTLTSNAKLGASIMIDYAWKLSGYHRRPSIYLSVPLGFTRMTDPSSQHADISILYYGWTIRHELRKNKKIIPYLGYSLLLNQLWIKGTEGHAIGHQTRLETGLNFYKKSVAYFFKIEFTLASFPQLGSKITYRSYGLDLKGGIRL